MPFRRFCDAQPHKIDIVGFAFLPIFGLTFCYLVAFQHAHRIIVAPGFVQFNKLHKKRPFTITPTTVAAFFDSDLRSRPGVLLIDTQTREHVRYQCDTKFDNEELLADTRAAFENANIPISPLNDQGNSHDEFYQQFPEAAGKRPPNVFLMTGIGALITVAIIVITVMIVA